MFVYLDNSSTTKQYPEVTKRMALAAEDFYGNPSSLHSLGLASEKKVREARKYIADSLGAREDEIIFTSGGTESDNTSLFGIAHARRHRGNKIITSAVEHPAVLEACKRLETEGFDVKYIGVDEKCHLNMDQLASEIDDSTILISLMAVNNETGTIFPIRDAVKMKKQAVFHTDAVQGYGKIDMHDTGADLISISGHKIHGPKGIGALYIRKGLNLPAYIVGGGQERNMRSGTENVPAIMGFGKAGAMSMRLFDERIKSMQTARNYLLASIKDQITDIKINSPEDETVAPSVLNVSFLGTRGEVLLHTLEQDEIFVSTGSACSSNKKGRSHVLASMGLSEREIEGAIRFSFSEFNTIEEMDYVTDKLKSAVEKFRKLGSFR